MSVHMVEVNNKFLVKLDHPNELSNLQAEHYFLDQWECVWGANAYDIKAMKTECFIGAMIHDELISLKELSAKLTRMDEQIAAVKKVDEQMADIDRRIKELMAEKQGIAAIQKQEHEAYRKMCDEVKATRPE